MDSLKALLTSVGKLSQIPLSSTVQKLYAKKGRFEAEKERTKVLNDIEEDLEDQNHSDPGNSPPRADPDKKEVLQDKDQLDYTPQKRVRKGDVVDYLEKKQKVDKCIFLWIF